MGQGGDFGELVEGGGGLGRLRSGLSGPQGSTARPRRRLPYGGKELFLSEAGSFWAGKSDPDIKLRIASGSSGDQGFKIFFTGTNCRIGSGELHHHQFPISL